MNSWTMTEEAEIRDVYPARDAERSEHAINDRGKKDVSNSGRLPELVIEQQWKSNSTLAPIGVFDSGAGGLTILTALRQELPNENYIYLGDTANCPYGMRSEEEITELALKANRFLIEQGTKLIVVACNTATQAALSTLRASFSIPIIGVVPAVKPAARGTKSGSIGIAATNRAVKATYLRQLIEDFAAGIEVYSVGCPDLVTLVEHGELDGPAVEEIVRRDLQPLLAKGVDVIVLGCTHFPALRPAIEQVVGKNIQIIDSGRAVARRTHAVMDAEGLTRANSAPGGELSVWSSGDAQNFSEIASKVLGYPVTAQQALL